MPNDAIARADSFGGFDAAGSQRTTFGSSRVRSTRRNVDDGGQCECMTDGPRRRRRPAAAASHARHRKTPRSAPGRRVDPTD